MKKVWILFLKPVLLNHQTNNGVSLQLKKATNMEFFNLNRNPSIADMKNYLETGITERGIIFYAYNLRVKNNRQCLCVDCGKKATQADMDKYRGLQLLENSDYYNELLYCDDCKKPLFDINKDVRTIHARPEDVIRYTKELEDIKR